MCVCVCVCVTRFPNTCWPSLNYIKESLVFWPWDIRNKEKYQQDQPTRIETPNTENLNTTDPSTTKQELTQVDKINVDLIKKNHDWKEDYITISQEPRLENSM